MPQHRWPAQLPPDELGAVVHGPVVLARSPGIAAGVRCVLAHPGGLRLPLVLRARDVQAEAAARATFLRNRGDHEAWSGPLLTVELDGLSGVADPLGQRSSGGDDDFSLDADCWLGGLPPDGRVRLAAGGSGRSEHRAHPRRSGRPRRPGPVAALTGRPFLSRRQPARPRPPP